MSDGSAYEAVLRRWAGLAVANAKEIKNVGEGIVMNCPPRMLEKIGHYFLKIFLYCSSIAAAVSFV